MNPRMPSVRRPSAFRLSRSLLGLGLGAVFVAGGCGEPKADARDPIQLDQMRSEAESTRDLYQAKKADRAKAKGKTRGPRQ